jgi:hypothetical protein
VRNLTQKREILEIEFLLALPNASGGWTRQLFLLDTGSQFTTVPIEFAESLGISLVESKPVRIQGTTGSASGYIAPVRYSLASLHQWQFTADWCFSKSPPRRPLLSLTDLLRQFTLRTLLPSRLHPLGSVRLQLRRDHQGQPRSF